MWTVTNGWLRNQLNRIFGLSVTPTDGQILVYDDGVDKFVNATPVDFGAVGGVSGQVQVNDGGNLNGLDEGATGNLLMSQGAGVAPAFVALPMYIFVGGGTAPYPHPIFSDSFIANPTAFSAQFYGMWTSVPMLIGVGDDILMLSSAGVLNLPDSTDGFDLMLRVFVSNQDGTEYVEAQWTKVIPAHTSSGNIVLSDAPTIITSVGTDITYNAGATKFVSAAGGIFTVSVWFSGGYD